MPCRFFCARRKEKATIVLMEDDPTITETTRTQHTRMNSFTGPTPTMRDSGLCERQVRDSPTSDQEQALPEERTQNGELALHPQCMASTPTLESVTDLALVNNILFFIEGAYLKLTGDELLFAPDPKTTRNGFEYFDTRPTAPPCAACKRAMETGLIARLLKKAAVIPDMFGAERVTALAHRAGVYRSDPKDMGTVINKRRMSKFFRNHRGKRAEVLAHLEQGESKRQGLIIIYAESDV